jgi:hypothetical protein
MEPARVEIVSGPTCCGKSVYIAGLPPGAYDEVLFADRADADGLRDGRRYLLHYNVLRPFAPPRFKPTHIRAYGRAVAHRLRRVQARLGRSPFAFEPWLGRLLARPHAFHATVLVAPGSVLLGRVGGRSALEPLIPEVERERYQRERWAKVYRSVDLPAVCRDWFAFLRQHRVDYSIVDSSTPEYRPVAGGDDEAFRILAS